MRLTLLALALALLLAAPAQGHSAPRPSETDVRLLQDWLDDCGGDGGAAQGSCRGSNDLLALDLQEVHDATLGDAVVFRLYLDEGQPGPRRNVITLTAPSGTKTFTFQTSNDATFTNGGGFDRVGAPKRLPGEQTRFTIDGTVRLSALGALGDTLRDFKVEAYAGNQVGDHMPGGCNNTLGACIETPGQREDEYIRREYVLRGPVHYASIDVPPDVQGVAAGAERMVEVRVTNLLSTQPQSVTLTADVPPGVQARFHNPNDHSASGYSHTGRVDLPARGTSVLHLAIVGQTPGAEGQVGLVLTTSLGGRAVESVSFTVTEGVPDCPGAGCPDPHDMHTSPALATGSAALLLVALAAWRRRS